MTFTFTLEPIGRQRKPVDEGSVTGGDAVPTRLGLPARPTPAWTQSITFTAIPRNASRARAVACDWMEQWGCSERQMQEAALVIGELTANAVWHAAAGEFTLRVARCSLGLQIEVDDPAVDRLPVLQSAGVDQTHGRGIVLVSACASAWGVRRLASRKTVWAVIGPAVAGPR